MNKEKLTDPYEIARYIKDAVKTTPVKLYINGNLAAIDFRDCRVYGSNQSAVVFGEYEQIKRILSENKEQINDYDVESDRRNSAIPLLDTKEISARIEPGAVIRDRVEIGKGVVIMMGALINIGAEIGEGTMIDMGAIVGARGIIGKNCHIGAGAVIAGVLEPPSKTPVIVGDDVVIGANAVILEGVAIGNGAVVAAGAIVTESVPEGAVVAGSPARIVKMKDEKTANKTQILEDLRDRR
ncbi:MAG: 2,3,4,5-tetrahydropyridine-2,6-dicarboxylate N-acetyltransferase [Eubacteriales bacterium]|nr:2,3,4,5-tetrahydropyridine-2,6-dicarboxylate N-acetyltransferase [Eubacteriales bacterium]